MYFNSSENWLERRFVLIFGRAKHITSLSLHFTSLIFVLHLNFEITVEPCYFELGQFKVLAISNKDRIPLDLPWTHVFNHILSAISNLVTSNSLLFRTHRSQPCYFELIKNRVQEETPKPPRKSEVRQAIKTLLLQFSTAANPVVIHDQQKY